MSKSLYLAQRGAAGIDNYHIHGKATTFK